MSAKKSGASGNEQVNITTSSPGDEKYLALLKEIVLSFVDTEKVIVFLFGSRASEQHASRSDADIGLMAEGMMPEKVYHKIKNAIDDSIIPWEVDIVDFAGVSPAFKREALKKIIIWNKPKGMKIS